MLLLSFSYYCFRSEWHSRLNLVFIITLYLPAINTLISNLCIIHSFIHISQPLAYVHEKTTWVSQNGIRPRLENCNHAGPIAVKYKHHLSYRWYVTGPRWYISALTSLNQLPGWKTFTSLNWIIHLMRMNTIMRRFSTIQLFANIKINTLPKINELSTYMCI